MDPRIVATPEAEVEIALGRSNMSFQEEVDDACGLFNAGLSVLV